MSIQNKIDEFIGEKELSIEFEEYAQEAKDADDAFRINEPELVKTIEKVCGTLDKKMPLLTESPKMVMNGYYNHLKINSKLAKKLSPEGLEAIISHELGHTESSVIGSLFYELTSKSFLFACFSYAVFNNQDWSRNFLLVSIAANVIVGSYKRSEEFRCDEETLKTGTSEDLYPALQHISDESYKISRITKEHKILGSLINATIRILEAFAEPIHSHPSNWVRRENLRQAKAEIEKQTPELILK